MTEIAKALTRQTSRRGLLSTGAATAIAGGCLLAATPSLSRPVETEMARLHRVLVQRKSEYEHCYTLAEQGPPELFDETVEPAIEAKWAAEEEILDAQAETPADARIQLTVYADRYDIELLGTGDHTECIDRVIASAIRALS
jgi:hypothetical protein